MITIMPAEVAVRATASVGEDPLWDAGTGQLYGLDIEFVADAGVEGVPVGQFGLSVAGPPQAPSPGAASPGGPIPGKRGQ